MLIASFFGLALLKLGRPAEAVAPLEQVVRQHPELPAARYNLACAYARVGRLSDAWAALEQAVANRPPLAALAAHDPALAALREQADFSNRLQKILAPP